MTVAELIKALADKPQDAEVQVWLPGSRIYLSGTSSLLKGDKVLIEGNVTAKSVLAGGPGEK